MCCRLVPLIVLLSVSAIGVVFPDTREEAISRLRARITEYGEMLLNGWAEAGTPRPGAVKAARLSLLKEPTDLVREAADIGIRQENWNERIGAMGANGILMGFKHEPANPAYRPIMLDLLARDDLTSPRRTRTIVGFLNEYPCRETLLAFMDAAARTQDLDLKEFIVNQATGLLGMELRLDMRSTPLDKAKAFAEFESWFEANKNRIRFNSKGEPRIRGGGAGREVQTLRPEDRARIREDPVCVLRLAHGGLSDEEGGPSELAELNRTCGPALLGAEGSELLSRGLSASGPGPLPLDLQAEMASAQGKYPVMDAILLAAAYVTAYETDPESLELARETLDEFGSPDMPRVLKGEPREVKKKAMVLMDEVLGKGE